MEMILQETYALSNGVEIPRIGLGTWLIDNDDVVHAVKDAVAIGYRHIDTAQAYGNEAGVAEATRASGVNPDELFLTTKLAAEVKTYDEAVQEPLPVWVGVGGSPQSAARAGQLGLPMTLGLIGGPLAGARDAVEIYRAAGERAGHPQKLKLGISTHFYAAEDAENARRIYPYYHEYLRPKTPGGRGFLVSEEGFRAGTTPDQAVMIGAAEEITTKILDAHATLGGIDRFYGQVDWGGLPRELVQASISLLASEIAPAVRAALNTETRTLQLTSTGKDTTR